MSDVRSTVRAILASTPDRWLALTSTASAELLTRAPAAGEWSALACLEHLVDTERDVFPIRLRAFLEGRDFAAFDPDAKGVPAPGVEDAHALAEEFARLRAASLHEVDRLADADLERTARHAELGIVTLREMLNEWAAHDLNHTVQAERALMQSFIAGTGPWRPYFADHDAEASA